MTIKSGLPVEKSPASDAILVAVDGSLPAQISARAAVRVAKKQGLIIRGVHVMKAHTTLEGDHSYKSELNLEKDTNSPNALRNQFKFQGNEALDWLEELCFTWNVPVTTNMMFGGISEMILEEAKHAKLLTLGRRGHVHHNNVYTLGENFRNIMAHPHGPILIGGDLLTSFKRLYIVFSDHNDVHNLISWATQLHNSFSSDILVSLFGDNETHPHHPSSALEQLTKEATFSFSKVGGKIQSGSDIVVAARDHEADFILMEGYRYKALGLWVEKHPLDEVLLNSEIMVLAI